MYGRNYFLLDKTINKLIRVLFNEKTSKIEEKNSTENKLLGLYGDETSNRMYYFVGTNKCNIRYVFCFN